MDYRKNDSTFKNILICILIVAIIFLTILIIVFCKKDAAEENKPTEEPAQTATLTVLVTPTPTPDNDPFATETPDVHGNDPTTEPDITPTATPTAAPVTPTRAPDVTPTPTPDGENIYATGMNPTEGSLMDYSFLAGVSTDYFHDINIHDYYTSGKNKGKLMGSWWSGTEIKDSNGNVTNVKRSAATEALLQKYDACYIDRNAGKTIYLTFDCGNGNAQLGKILDTLKEKNVHAIFFVTGTTLEEAGAKELMQRILNEGHMIGSHTYNHPNMMLSSNDTFVTELQKIQTRLNELLGYEYRMTFYRPPEGASNERDLALAKHLGLRTVFWSFAYYDYNVNSQMDPSKAFNDYLKAKIHPGAVYLLHACSSTNAEILDDFIDYGRNQGYTFARIDEYGK